MARKKRPNTISLRLPVGQREEFFALWAASGKSMNAFVLEEVFGRPIGRARRAPAKERLLAASMLAPLADICDRLRALHSGASSSEQAALAQCLDDMQEMRAAIMQICGRDE
jgi:hypothetical protein